MLFHKKTAYVVSYKQLEAACVSTSACEFVMLFSWYDHRFPDFPHIYVVIILHFQGYYGMIQICNVQFQSKVKVVKEEIWPALSTDTMTLAFQLIQLIQQWTFQTNIKMNVSIIKVNINCLLYHLKVII